MPSVRILIICQWFPPEYAPIGIMLRELAQDLSAKGHEVTVFCQKKYSDPDSPDCYKGVRLVYLPTLHTKVTETLNYAWQNTGIAANIDQATTVTGGTAVVAIRDAAGVQVYSAGLQSNGTFQSATGQTGNWTIQVVLSNYSGTLNFRAQKRTP